MSKIRSWYYSPLVLKRVMIFAVIAFEGTTSVAADFPKLQQQVDSTPHPFGTGTCETQRTGVWFTDGGVVVEVQKPKQCRFESLYLVVDGKRFSLTAADQNFYRGMKWDRTGSSRVMMYEWMEDAGKLFFRTERQIDPSKIQGIIELDCAGTNPNCLDEAAAIQAQRQ